MPSATDFFPAYITEFMNLVMMMFPNFGSGSTSRFSAEWRRDISYLPSSGRARPGHPRLNLLIQIPGSHYVTFARDDPRYIRLISDASRRTSNGAACGS